MNSICFEYMYRDASNYKKGGEIIFSNPNNLSEKSIEERLSWAMEGGEYFIAGQVGIPEVFLYDGISLDDDDHCWHEMCRVSPSAEAFADTKTDTRTIDEFITDVEKASRDGWELWNPNIQDHTSLIAA